MRNRVVWGLVAVLTVVVLFGSVVLVALYQRRLPVEQRTVMLLPVSLWGFHHYYIYLDGPTLKFDGNEYVCGFFAVNISHSKIRYPTGLHSAKHGPHVRMK
jgi:hypothetical protein